MTAFSLLMAWMAMTSTRGDAAQMEVSRLELCSISDAVVVARVADVEASWAAGASGAIERRVIVDVDHAVRGKAGAAPEVVLPGGRIGEAWTFVEDVPELEVGRRYLLFLDRVDGHWAVIGGDQGAVPIASRVHKGEYLSTVMASVEGCDAQ